MIVLAIAPFYILANIYMLVRILRFLSAIHERLRHPVIWTICVVTYVFFMTTPLTGFLIRTESIHRFLMAVSNYWLGVIVIALLVTVIFDIVRIIGNKTWWKYDHPNEARHKKAGLAAFVLICFISGYGCFHGGQIEYNFQKINVEKPLGSKYIEEDKESLEQEELRIVLVADTHIGYNVGYSHISKVVDMINKAEADIVVFAGDIFDNSYDAIGDDEKIMETLSKIKSKYGTYACWGNHDVPERLLAGFTISGDSYSKDSRFYNFLEKSNIKMMEDEVLLIDDSFYLVGRKDPSMSEKLGEERMSPEELLKKTDKNLPIIVIDHQPHQLEELAEAGVDLDLSGHTHNGQIAPGNLLLGIQWQNPYGVKKIGDMYSVVTSGAGYWGPAMRIGTDCEVMVIDVEFGVSQ